MLYVNSSSWAEEPATSKHLTPAIESATPGDIPLSVESFRTSTGEANVSNPSHPVSEKSQEANKIVNELAVETPDAIPQTTADNTLQQVETLEESLQKITVMAKVLNSLGSEVDETLRSAALNVAEADKSNDKELYRQAVHAFEILYEKQFGKTEPISSVQQGLAESLKKVEVMSKVIEVMNPKATVTVELSDAAKRVFAADNAGDKEAYHQAVEVFEALYQAAVSEKAVK